MLGAGILLAVVAVIGVLWPRVITVPLATVAAWVALTSLVRAWRLAREQELGVRCVAVAVPGVRAHLALSVSGPAGRMTPETVDHAVPLLAAAGRALAAELAS